MVSAARRIGSIKRKKKTRIVCEGLRGEENIAALCHREGVSESLYYSWSKDFMEAGKKRLASDTVRQATSNIDVMPVRHNSKIRF